MYCRALLIAFALIATAATAWSQQYKHSVLGISLQYEQGYTLPNFGFNDDNDASLTSGLNIRTISFGQREDAGGLNRWYTLSNTAAEDPRASYSLALALSYSFNTPKYNIWLLEAGYRQSKRVYYYDVLQPDFGYLDEASILQIYDWHFLNQGFANLIYSQHLTSDRWAYLNFKGGVTYSRVTDNLFSLSSNRYSGYSESGSLLWSTGNAFTNSLRFDRQVNTQWEYGATLGASLSLRFGSSRQHELYGGLSLYTSFGEPFVREAAIFVDESGTQLSRDDYQLGGSALFLEFGYRFPLVRSKRPYRASFAHRRPSTPPTRPVPPTRPAPPTRPTPPAGGSQPTASREYPGPRTLAKEVEECFKVKGVIATPTEIVISDDDGELEIEFYADQDDGDRISVCYDGKLVVDNREVTANGFKQYFKVNARRGESTLIIYFHQAGDDSRSKVYLNAIGSGVEYPQLSKPLGSYHWVKLKRG